MTAYYNEIDPYAAQWLRNLIAAGHIAPGIVDERSIEDVTPNELKHYTQCHFFAGIGVWSLALRRAGWPDDRPVWTGSCPCQPFSSAGKGGGFDDERHLWPAFHHLIEQCRPATVIGEQVASKDAEPWLDLVQTDLEAVGYAFGAVPFPSASVGAPHIRDRLYWVADTVNEGPQGRVRGGQDSGRQDQHGHVGRSGAAIGLADTNKEQRRWWSNSKLFTNGAQAGWQQSDRVTESDQQVGGMADTDVNGSLDGINAKNGWGAETTAECGGDSGLADAERVWGHDRGRVHWGRTQESSGIETTIGSELRNEAQGTSSSIGMADTEHDGRSGQENNTSESRGNGQNIGLSHGGHSVPQRQSATGPTNGFWGAADWLLCRDGKWRPVEPGTFPLVNGASSRVGRLRAYGNAINAQAAQVFIECIK
jgi:DNA (cytosine-5)-methyltransferase 1